MRARAGRAPRRRYRAAWLRVVAAAAFATIRAQDAAIPPEGFQLGPVVLAPSVTAGYLYDTNLLYQSESNDPQPDGLSTVQPAFTLTLPFGASHFRLADTLLWRDYSKTAQISGRYSNDATAELGLVFGSSDKLTAGAHNVAGIAETGAFDPTGEVVFRGEQFTFHNEALRLERDERGARGYKLSLQRNALRFDSTTSSFFNYRGFDAEAAYVEPLNPRFSLGFGYIGTRYDHFDTEPGANPHEVFRQEEGDTAYLLFHGWFSSRQAYRVQLGYEQLAFTGGGDSGYRGVVGLAELDFVVGAHNAVHVSLLRQPYRSFFGRDENGVVLNNYSLFHEVSVRAHRTFQRGSDFGMVFSLAQTDYSVPVFAGVDLGDVLRSDRTGLVELYGNLAVRERVAFRVSVRRTRRNSNFPNSDYVGTQIFGGFVFGWL